MLVHPIAPRAGAFQSWLPFLAERYLNPDHTLTPSASNGTVKLRHSGSIRPQDVGDAVRSSPII